MQEELVRKIANLMNEQTAAFSSLEGLTNQLSGALVRGEPNMIENLARTGEGELRRMRARLLEITTSLSDFADANRAASEPLAIGPETRREFEDAANNLIGAAKDYQILTRRAETLAVGGSSFAAACIQVCGVLPSTYSAPVIRPSAGGNTV